MTAVQWIGLYLALVCGATLLLAALHHVGHRTPTEPRRPRCIIRANDYLDSYRDYPNEPQQVQR